MAAIDNDPGVTPANKQHTGSTPPSSDDHTGAQRLLRSVYTKLALVVVGLYLFIGGAVAVLMIYTSDVYHQEVYQKLHRDLAQQIVNRGTLVKNGLPNEAWLKQLFNTMMTVNPDVDVYLLDSMGNILAHSAPEEQIQAGRVGTGAIRRFLAGEPLPVLGADPRQPDQDRIFSVAPVTEGRDLHGYLYVIVAGERHDNIAAMLRESYVLKLSLWTAGAGMTFALLTALVIFSLLTRRLRRLTSAVEGFRANGYRRVPAPDRSNSFNHAARQKDPGEG